MLYDVQSRERIGALRVPNNFATSLAFLPDGRLLISGITSAEIWSIGRSLPPVGVVLPAPSRPGYHRQQHFYPGPMTSSRAECTATCSATIRRPAQIAGPMLAGAITSPAVASPDGRLLPPCLREAEQLRFGTGAAVGN